MWLITNFGFFSVVQKSGETMLTIRARALKDLENLKARYLPELGKISKAEGTDYQYRAKVSREEFAEAAKKISMDIDYPNFKNSVVEKQGIKRADIYHEVWASLWRISKETEDSGL